MTNLEKTAHRVFKALNSVDDKWLKRDEIARLIGKKHLQTTEVFALEYLILGGKVQGRVVRTDAPTGIRFEYRSVLLESELGST